MDAITAINKFVSYPEIKPLTELPLNVACPVTDVRFIPTRYGKTVVINVKIENEEFSVYLPHRLYSFLSEETKLFEEIKLIISKENLTITYLGGENRKFEFHDTSTEDSNIVSESIRCLTEMIQDFLKIEDKEP